MKTARKCLGLLLVLTLLVSLTIPVSAATMDDYWAAVDDYWAAYDAGWSEGYDAGYAAYVAGGTPTLPVDTDAVRQSGYVEGYTAGYDDASWEQQWMQNQATTVNQDIPAAGGRARPVRTGIKRPPPDGRHRRGLLHAAYSISACGGAESAGTSLRGRAGLRRR